MSHGIALAPCGLAIEGLETDAKSLLIVARSASMTANCPACGNSSTKIHRKYQRFLLDSPSRGRAVRIRIQTRRFRCVLTDCRQRIFSERLEAIVTHSFARRTSHLEGIVRHLGLALGGQGNARAPSAPSGEQ